MIGRAVFVVGLACAGFSAALAAPSLGAADRASIDSTLSSLRADPFADAPLAELQTIYRRGPGVATLIAELNERVQRAPLEVADLIVLGRLQLDHGKRAEATRALSRAVAATSNPALLRGLARLLDEQGARADAIRAYQGARAGASPTELRAILLRLGVLLLAEGKIADARALWAEAVRAAPGDLALRRQIAEALASRGAYREAATELGALEPLVAPEPQVLISMLRREAEFLNRAGDHAPATDALLRAYVICSGLRQSAIRAELTLDLVRTNKARSGGMAELMQIVKRLEVKTPQMATLIADLLAASDDRKGAVNAFHRALDTTPGDPYVLRRLCALEVGETRIQDLGRLFDLERSDATIGLDLVAALFEAKRAADAVERARAVQARFADNPAVLAELTRLLAKNQQHAAALATAELVVKLDPTPDAIVARADELKAAGRSEEATRAYFSLVEVDSSANGYRHLIEILSRRRLFPELKRAYVEALLRAPDSHVLRRDYARLLVSQGDLKGALAQWTQLAASNDPFLRDFAQREVKRIEKDLLLNQ